MKKEYKLEKYIELFKKEGIVLSAAQNIDAQVLNLFCNSKEVNTNTLFFCKGVGFKKEYLLQAQEKGILAYVSEIDFDIALPCILVNDVKKAMSLAANLFYDNPWLSYPCIGITGTKGKSTTLAYVQQIFKLHTDKKNLNPFAYISTIDTFDGIDYYQSQITTPEAFDLYRNLDNARTAKVSALGMEVSSQALKYHRTYGIKYDITAFLNFGLDHIGESEHTDLEDYFQSKLLIFKQAKKTVLNLDTDRKEEIFAAAKKYLSKEDIITFSVKDPTADFYAKDIRKENGIIHFRVFVNGKASGDFSLTMPGLFNVENALAAIAICSQFNIDLETMKEALFTATAGGRMELYKNEEKKIHIIVDYAHNEMSFEKLCQSTKEEFPGFKIVSIFGAAGMKAFTRRTALPKVAAKYCDYSYITEEDPAREPVEKICDELLSNLKSFGGNGEIIIDREKAFETAYKKASTQTIILAIAKGCDTFMHRGDNFDTIRSDVEIAKELTQN